MSEASGSKIKPGRRSKDAKKTKGMNNAKQRRLTEKQQIAALEQQAMAFVSANPQGLPGTYLVEDF